MAEHEFKVIEVKRDGYIAWDAIEVSTKKQFPVNADGYYEAGTFPEISEHLKKEYGLSHEIKYIDGSGDEFDGRTWSFKREGDVIKVHDIPRTLLRIGAA
ncbi:MAG TPA: hypothetical protein VIM93_09665 [Kangiella sp.]